VIQEKGEHVQDGLCVEYMKVIQDKQKIFLTGSGIDQVGHQDLKTDPWRVLHQTDGLQAYTRNDLVKRAEKIFQEADGVIIPFIQGKPG
jgi:hypothetical protein